MQRLLTAAGANLPALPWERYPRPQLRRPDWLCLNGVWEFSFGNVKQNIRVPFCPASLLSGVERAPACGETLRYARRFSVPAAWRDRRVLLRFGAVSRNARVEVNGLPAGTHDNGYLPFALDVTDLLRPGENELTVFAVNDLDVRHLV